MFQDQELLNDLHSLPPVKQAEVVDFIQFLKHKQLTQEPLELDEQKKLELAAELLLKTPNDIDPDEIALWDAVVSSSEEPFQVGEPELTDYN